MHQPHTSSGFAALGITDAYSRILREHGIVEPTPIQRESIPIGLSGSDLMGIAQTGTGKTLAFGLPIAQRLERGQSALILAPTRELALQISETLRLLRVGCCLVVGGAPMHRQTKELRARPAVIVATPGRLIDHMNQGHIRFDSVRMVVLDEADRMLDMGFAPSIKRILDHTPKQRQTLLFSATMPIAIAQLAATYLRDPKAVEIDPSGSVSDRIEHEVIYLPFAEKPAMLETLLKEHDGTALVFTRTRHGARKLAKVVRSMRQTAAELHADRTLAQRREALSGFKTGQYRVLVATDIAARGIDVKEIELVVNYDVPENPVDYVHRIGRTGRAGAAGKAFTLALPEQDDEIRDIEKVLGEDLPISARSLSDPPRRRRPQTRQPRPTVSRTEAAPAAAPPAAASSGAPSRPGHRGWSGRPRKRRFR